MLKAYHFDVWYAPDKMKPGDRILSSIEAGMENTNVGILLLSKSYFAKPWPQHELNRLFTKFIEQGHKIIPIWVDVEKHEVREFLPSLSDVYSLSHSDNFYSLYGKILDALASGAACRLAMPSYEAIAYRFISGQGEMTVGMDGPATTLWEFLIHSPDNYYPVVIGDKLYSKTDLLCEAATRMLHIPDVVKNWIGDDGFEKLRAMCVEAGLDPQMLS